MILDGFIILAYFTAIMVIGIHARAPRDVGTDEYFLSARSLKWPSIAMSTIATNIHANHFIAMAGSAYLYGLAQANLEINAIFGVLVATFFFVPLYLRLRVVTITQFFENRLGPHVALAYSLLMIVLNATLLLGTALFWAAYAIDGLFGDLIAFLGASPAARMGILIVVTGLFSAVYTYLGGLRAVVRTDVLQFALLVVGGLITVAFTIRRLGGWSHLWTVTGDLMHLHLPADHEKLPWTGLFGMFLLNLNYWGANQVILQRALAARSLRHAQIGLLVGGAMKYLMVIIIIIPGIALAGLRRDRPLHDPDQAYLTVINTLLPAGLRGLILCGLFASLMSTLDSVYNSVATLWSIDIYKHYLKPAASERHVVRSGKRSIMATLVIGVLFGFLVLYVKIADPSSALTHWFNDRSYYIKSGFVLLVVAAVFLVKPSRRLVLSAFLCSGLLTYVFEISVPGMNYFVRSGWVIVLTLALVGVPTVIRNGWRLPGRGVFISSHRSATRLGIALALSLLAAHVVFH